MWDADNNYWAITFNVSGFSGFFIGNSVTTILPLQLISFTGLHQPRQNLLQWAATNQTNTKTFAIEHSTNGRNFNSIGTVAANGRQDGNYTFNDAAYHNATAYYRLKITESNGQYTYSPIIKLATSKYLLTVYPNPASQYITISGIAPGGMVQITDMLGRVLLQQKTTANTETLDISKLARGSYVLRYHDGKMDVVEKVVVE